MNISLYIYAHILDGKNNGSQWMLLPPHCFELEIVVGLRTAGRTFGPPETLARCTGPWCCRNWGSVGI